MYGRFAARIFQRGKVKPGKIPGYCLPLFINLDALR
jgi:hypothetical protein